MRGATQPPGVSERLRSVPQQHAGHPWAAAAFATCARSPAAAGAAAAAGRQPHCRGARGGSRGQEGAAARHARRLPPPHALPRRQQEPPPPPAKQQQQQLQLATQQQQQPKRRRFVLYGEFNAIGINWDRWELLMYRRAEERGELDEGEDEEGAEGEEGEEEEQDGAREAGGPRSLASRTSDRRLAPAYFQRYDDPAAHQASLQDRVLVGAWRDALAAAPPGALAGRVVLDVGCGLGLVSMLAAQAGAARVIAVDGSAGACESARRIVRANGLEDRITVVHGAMEALDSLPGVSPGGVDVVVSQWMGRGLLGGGMAAAVAAAAAKWLRPGGLVLPDRVSLWAAALEDRDALAEAKESWSRVGGLDMSAALAQAIRHPRTDVLTRRAQLLSAPARLASWECAALRPGSLLEAGSGAYATCPLRLSAVRDERMFGLVLWWDAEWSFGGALRGGGGADDAADADDDVLVPSSSSSASASAAPSARPAVRFTTHPLAAETHYQQLMLNLPRSVRLAAGDEVSGLVVVRPGEVDPRDLVVEARLDELPGGGAPIEAAWRVAHA